MYAVATDHTKPRKGSNHGSKLPKAVNMTKHGGDMTKHVTNRIHYFEQLHKQIDAHSTKAESIALRISELFFNLLRRAAGEYLATPSRFKTPSEVQEEPQSLSIFRFLILQRSSRNICCRELTTGSK